MIISIILAILLGCLVGTITGLIPGLHINLVAALVVSISTLLLSYTAPLILIIFIASMSILHTFTNVIPSIYLGAPEEGTALSVLPGHKMLLAGKGYAAVKLTVIGSLIGLIAIITLIPLFLISIPKIYPFIQEYIALILIITSIILILKEKKSKVWASTMFFMAGILGIISLNLKLEQPLLPLLSGLFGTSTLTLSLKEKTKIPRQRITKTKIKTKELFKSITSGVIASTICGILPGIGSAQAAIIASSISKKWTIKTWLILIGAIDTIVMVIGFVALYTINKTRNGSVVAISKLITNSVAINGLVPFFKCNIIKIIK